MSAYGPFATSRRSRSGSRGALKLDDPYSYAIVEPTGRAVGIATLMEIRPAMRVIEVGHIVYSPALQRTPLGTEAQYLLARYAFETLGYRRYEWKCNALNAPSRRAALRYGFAYEGTPAPAHDRQGPQPRQRLCTRCSTANGRPARRRSSAGSRRRISSRGEAADEPRGIEPERMAGGA